MASFGPPVENEPPYPGVSGVRFNPVEASKIWAEALKKEKELRYVHQVLDAHNQLGLDEKWAKGIGGKACHLPGSSSLESAYKKLGWKRLDNGRSFAPDPDRQIRKHNEAVRKRAMRAGQEVVVSSSQSSG